MRKFLIYEIMYASLHHSSFAGVKVDISARNFLQNIEYEFRVKVQKVSRTSVDEQTVLFAEGDPPTILLGCQDNCGAKINTQGEVAYSLDCAKYKTWQQ